MPACPAGFGSSGLKGTGSSLQPLIPTTRADWGHRNALFCCRLDAMMEEAGLQQNLTQEQWFQAYIEYLMKCYAEPSFAADVRNSDRHSRFYLDGAIRKIEEEIGLSR